MKISLEDFMIQKGFVNKKDFCCDMKNEHLSRQQSYSRLYCIRQEEEKMQKQKRKLIDEYYRLVDEGIIIPLTDEEELIAKANGIPEHASTQAARRILRKKKIRFYIKNGVYKLADNYSP